MPNPLCDGGDTGGPAFSIQLRMSRSPFNDGTTVQVISIEPASFENAPYFAALVASSLNAIPNARVTLGDSRILSPATTKRLSRVPETPNGSNASITTSRRPALAHFSRVNKS